MSSVSTLTPTLSTPTATKSLRIGVLAAIGTLDPRDSGDTITGLMLGQVFEMAFPLIYGASTAIRSRKVKNFHIAPSGHVDFADVEMF